MKKLIVMGALPVLAMAAPQLAMAAEQAPAGHTTQMAKVSYAGLDLTTQEGQDELMKRIQRAAREVCSRDNSRPTATETLQRNRCMRVALEKGEKQFAAIVSNARYGG